MMMTQKTAFIIVKAMEIYAFRQTMNNKINDYSLIYISVSSDGSYKLVLSAEWLYNMRLNLVLKELSEILQNTWNNKSKLPLISISIEKGNIGHKDIDGLIHLSNNFDTLKGDGQFGSRYSISTRNIPLNSGFTEDGYILKSKILSNFDFGIELFVLLRDKNWQKLIPISFQDDKINFLTEKGQYMFAKKLGLNKVLLNPENYYGVNVFDIYRVEKNINL
jgi:hypothetical protein